MSVLPEAENRMTASSFVWTKHRNVTDGRTDRQNSSSDYSGLHCEQCGRAVKKLCYAMQTRNSPGDEIANVNFRYDDIVQAQ